MNITTINPLQTMTSGLCPMPECELHVLYMVIFAVITFLASFCRLAALTLQLRWVLTSDLWPLPNYNRMWAAFQLRWILSNTWPMHPCQTLWQHIMCPTLWQYIMYQTLWQYIMCQTLWQYIICVRHYGSTLCVRHYGSTLCVRHYVSDIILAVHYVSDIMCQTLW